MKNCLGVRFLSCFSFGLYLFKRIVIAIATEIHFAYRGTSLSGDFIHHIRQFQVHARCSRSKEHLIKWVNFEMPWTFRFSRTLSAEGFRELPRRYAPAGFHSYHISYRSRRLSLPSSRVRCKILCYFIYGLLSIHS